MNIDKCLVGSQIKKRPLTARLKCIASVICREESYGCFYFYSSRLGFVWHVWWIWMKQSGVFAGSCFLPFSEGIGEGDKKSFAWFPLLCIWVLCMEGCPKGVSVMREWVCALKLSYPFTKHIPVVIVMSVSSVSRYAISWMEIEATELHR